MEEKKQEENCVRLKGVGDSLWVSLDPGQTFDRIQKDLKQVFDQVKQLAVNARVVIDPGPKNGHDELVQEIGLFLKETYSVDSVSKPSEARRRKKEMLGRRELTNEWYYSRSEALMLRGRIRSGQKITARKHLLVMGDVNPGGEILAGGDIFILGSLRGNATAGNPDDEQSIIFALDFRPIQVQIGGLVAAGLSSSNEEDRPEFARVENGVIVVEDYFKANPFGRIPGLELR
jgi:septum site-determining protein MinC